MNVSNASSLRCRFYLCRYKSTINRPTTPHFLHATCTANTRSSDIFLPSISWIRSISVISRRSTGNNNSNSYFWYQSNKNITTSTTSSSEAANTLDNNNNILTEKERDNDATIDIEKKRDLEDQFILGKSEESNTASSSTTRTTESLPLVYESPLGGVVSKLRAVSLSTAIIGMTGVPCMIAIKGGNIPEAGILAAALLFVTGSMGSTAAVHFVFSPYVYKIEQIPIRVCSTPSSVIAAQPKVTDVIIDTSQSTDNSNASIESNNHVDDVQGPQPGVETATTTTNPRKNKDTLLKAWIRTLFLRHETIVFDPTIDVQPYKGYRPMCNFTAKGRPLYVHPGNVIFVSICIIFYFGINLKISEKQTLFANNFIIALFSFFIGMIFSNYISILPEYVYDAKLRAAMNTNESKNVTPIKKENPDDDFL